MKIWEYAGRKDAGSGGKWRETLGKKNRASHDKSPEAEKMEIEQNFALSTTLGEENGRTTWLKLGKGKYLKLRTDT